MSYYSIGNDEIAGATRGFPHYVFHPFLRMYVRTLALSLDFFNVNGNWKKSAKYHHLVCNMHICTPQENLPYEVDSGKYPAFLSGRHGWVTFAVFYFPRLWFASAILSSQGRL